MKKKKEKWAIPVNPVSFGIIGAAVFVLIAASAGVTTLIVNKSNDNDSEVLGEDTSKCEPASCPPCEQEYFYNASDPLGRESTLYYTSELDLSVEEFSKCISNGNAYEDEIQEDIDAAGEVGITGTPGFVVGVRTSESKARGFLIPGAYPFETFDKALGAIDEKGLDAAFKEMESEIADPMYENQYSYLLQQYQEAEYDDAEQRAAQHAEEYVADKWKVVEVELGTNPPKGDNEAEIVIVEFTDYECPYCKRYVQETLPEIDEKYIKEGKVASYLRDLPLDFHTNSKSAAIATRCADEQDAYWEMHDYLFDAR